MSSFLNSRTKQIPPSGIRKFFDLAIQSQNVISLGVGEPGVPVPWEIREAAIFAIEKNLCSYTENEGLLPLRQEISRFLHKKYSLSYKSESEILITTAVSEAMDLAIRSVLEPGDEFLLPSPSYVMYLPLGQVSFGIPCFYDMKAKNIAAEIEKKISAKTKVLILNYPNNPLGKTLDEKDLREIADLVERKNILVLSDEIYSELTYDNKKHISFASMKNMKERTVTMNGFSKYFAMTGFRLGYACAPAELLAGMRKIHQYSMLCAPTISQHAALEALKNEQKIIPKIKKIFQWNRNLAMKKLKSFGFEIEPCEGAFYIFADIRLFAESSEQFATSLLKSKNVAVVPGVAFGKEGEGYVRISYAVEEKDLKIALKKIGEFVAEKK